MPSAPPLAWAGWDATTFDRASRENLPVLLYLSAAWSSACRYLDDRVFTREALETWLAGTVVPVRVDVDERPDIADRYGLGGWPTVLVLTPEGAVLTGGQQLDPARLADTLPRLRDVFRARRAELRDAGHLELAHDPTRPVANPASASDLPDLFLEQAAQAIEGHESGAPDPRWLPHPAAWLALLAMGRTRSNRRALDLAGRALDTAVRVLVHPEAGCVFRPSVNPYESPVERVALLEQNAGYLEAFLAAGVILERDDLRVRAATLAAFLRTDLRHADGGFCHAWVPAPDQPDDDRMRQGAVVDGRRFVDENADAARVCLLASHVLADAPLASQALDAIERAVASTYERRAGLAHVVDPSPAGRGLLGDQVAAAHALVEAYEATDMAVYLDLADELMQSVLRTHRDPSSGGLVDRVPRKDDVGSLCLALVPAAQNGMAARVCQRLARHREDSPFASQAAALLDACAAIPPEGPDTAQAVLAVLEGIPAPPMGSG